MPTILFFKFQISYHKNNSSILLNFLSKVAKFLVQRNVFYETNYTKEVKHLEPTKKICQHFVLSFWFVSPDKPAPWISRAYYAHGLQSFSTRFPSITEAPLSPLCTGAIGKRKFNLNFTPSSSVHSPGFDGDEHTSRRSWDTSLWGFDGRAEIFHLRKEREDCETIYETAALSSPSFQAREIDGRKGQTKECLRNVAVPLTVNLLAPVICICISSLENSPEKISTRKPRA